MSSRGARCRQLPGLVAAVGVLLPGAGNAGAQDLPANAALGDYLRLAEERSPSLEAGRRAWNAEREAAGAAGSFPDPQLSFAWYAQEVETRVGPQKQRVSVRQRLPWFGKLGLGEAAADEGARAAGARFDDRRLEIRRDVTLAWLELVWLGRAAELERANLEILTDLERVIRERYTSGQSAHADLIRIQMELGRAENRRLSVEDRSVPAQARMNALLDRPDGAPLPVPEMVPDWPAAPEASAVRAAVRAGAPRLRERDRRATEADTRRKLAERSRWPDWMVGVDWIRTDDALNPSIEDSGKDPVVVSLSVDVPIFRGKWDAPARAAEERVAMARAEREREEDVLVAEAEAVLWDWRDADRRIALVDDALLPKAQSAYQALSTAYRTGRGGFLDLVEAQRTLLEFELELERARTDRGRAAARLARWTGARDGFDGDGSTGEGETR